MKKVVFTLSVLALCAFTEESIHRESIEWCDIWVTSANRDVSPRVLMVGDSITRDYFKAAEKKIGDAAGCARIATSASVADTAFHQQLELVLSQYPYDVIHFNNGLHGFDYDINQYEAGYRKALETIRRLAPTTRIVLTLSTPLKPDSDKAYLTPTVDERNRVVEKLAKEFGLGIDDLYSISKGHPEYYRDPFHYKPEAIELQAEQVASVLKQALQDIK